ncbi:MAG: hypothetical protein M3Y77_10180 [Actinomycetota bacterium]|nr:hypothetical protein [Actinomycetota bacterium]
MNGLRDQLVLVSLACLRHGLAPQQGRGADDLPAEETATIAETLVRALDRGALSRAFAAAVTALLDEADHLDHALAVRLEGPAAILVGTAAG